MPKSKKAATKSDSIPMPESLEDRKQWLIDRAKKDGHISQKDVMAAIPDSPEHAEILDQLYTELADAGLTRNSR